MDNEKRDDMLSEKDRDDVTVESVESVESNGESSDESDEKGSVVIENFDEEKDEDEKRYEQYINLMNDNDEDDDIAAVAERITGERHSRVSTAAPIRVRENPNRTTPRSTYMPIRGTLRAQNVNPEQPVSPENPADAQNLTGVHEIPHTPSEAKKREIPKNRVGGKREVAASAALLVILLALTVAVVSIVLNKKEWDDPDVIAPPSNEEILTDENASHDETEIEPETNEPILSEEDSVVNEDENTADDLTENEEVTDESQTEQTEPIVEPEPTIPEYTVTLDFYDRDDIVVTVPEMTLAEVYAFAGYTPRDGDRPSVSLDTVIATDAYITIDTAEYINVSVTEVIPYGSEVIELDTIPRGDVNYLSYGENGEAVRTYTVEYINGAEVGRTLAWEETTKTPVNECYEIGVGGSFVGADGVTYTYSYRRTVPSTYYSIEGLTYLGTMADESVIAVDPDKIPLGTKVYVKNDTYDFGVRTAADVGPKVEEWEVDVWLSPSNSQYASYAATGYHYDMEIYYID